nr:hypothetical protein [Tanacetum cinerariifolium]
MLGLANIETWDNIVKKFQMRTPERCANKSKGKKRFDVEESFVEIQADDHDLLVNSDNENDDMLGYESEKEYGKLGGIKIKVTFDALNRLSGLHRALFLSFLGDLICEHIGLKILSWKKVDKELRDKLWDEIT